jgi:hypothetical protein
MDEDLAKNQYPKKVLPIRETEGIHKSLMAKALSPEVWEQYKDYKSKNGWTLARAINTGVMNLDSSVGCHAGDLESYWDMIGFYQPVIEGYHKGFLLESSKHITDLDPAKITIKLSDLAKSKIISTRIRVARNLNMFPLNTAGTKETRL